MIWLAGFLNTMDLVLLREIFFFECNSLYYVTAFFVEFCDSFWLSDGFIVLFCKCS